MSLKQKVLGSKNKLKRFRENEQFSNVIQPTRQTLENDDFEWKGRWQSYFNNNHPIVVELGCGKGEYSVGLAKEFPQKNFIGIDIKGARFWRGAKTALEEKIQNVAFVRTQIELIESIFDQSEVDEIWITFPDPQLKFKRTKHRLTNPSFLKKYNHILKSKGKVHLKTDSDFLHGYTLGLLQGLKIEVDCAHHDVYHYIHAPKEVTAIQTFYEQRYLAEGKSITYLSFQFPKNE